MSSEKTGSQIPDDKKPSHTAANSTPVFKINPHDHAVNVYAADRMRRFLAFRLATDYALNDSPYKLLPKRDWQYFVQLSEYCKRFFTCFGRFITSKDSDGTRRITLPLSDPYFTREVVEPCQVLGIDPIRHALYEIKRFTFSLRCNPRTGYTGIQGGFTSDDSTLGNFRKLLINDRDLRISQVSDLLPLPQSDCLKRDLLAANYAIAQKYFLDPSLGPDLSLTVFGVSTRDRTSTYWRKKVRSPLGRLLKNWESTVFLDMTRFLQMSDEEADQKLSRWQKRCRQRDKLVEHLYCRVKDGTSGEKSDKVHVDSTPPYPEEDKFELIDEKSPEVWSSLN